MAATSRWLVIALLVASILPFGALADQYSYTLFNTSNDLSSDPANGVYSYMFDGNYGGSWWQAFAGGEAAPQWVLVRFNNQSAFNVDRIDVLFYDTSYNADQFQIYGSDDANPNGTSGSWTYLANQSSDVANASVSFTNGVAYKWYLINMTPLSAPAYPAVYEITVFGNASIGATSPPVPPALVPYDNDSFTCYASSTLAGNVAQHLVDELYWNGAQNIWQASDGSYPQWVGCKFTNNSIMPIDGYVWLQYDGGGFYSTDIVFEVSNDTTDLSDGTWTVCDTRSSLSGVNNVSNMNTSCYGRAFRGNITAGQNYATVEELFLYFENVTGGGNETLQVPTGLTYYVDADYGFVNKVDDSNLTYDATNTFITANNGSYGSGTYAIYSKSAGTGISIPDIAHASNITACMMLANNGTGGGAVYDAFAMHQSGSAAHFHWVPNWPEYLNLMQQGGAGYVGVPNDTYPFVQGDARWYCFQTGDGINNTVWVDGARVGSTASGAWTDYQCSVQRACSLFGSDDQAIEALEGWGDEALIWVNTTVAMTDEFANFTSMNVHAGLPALFNVTGNETSLPEPPFNGTYYVEAHGYTADTSGGTSDWFGFNITTLFANMTLMNVTLMSPADASIAVVANSSGDVICKWGVANQTSCDLPYAGTYYIVVGADGTSYTRAWYSQVSVLPKNGSVLIFEGTIYDRSFGVVDLGENLDLGDDYDGFIMNVESITFAGPTLPPPPETPVDTTGFDGATTNFGAVNASEVDYPILEKVGQLKIDWNGQNLNFSTANLSAYVTYGSDWVNVQSANLPAGVNTSANVTLYGAYEGAEVYRDGQICYDCQVLSNNGSDVKFSVPHFTNYSIGNGTANGSLTLTAPANASSVNETDLVSFTGSLTQYSGTNMSWSCTLYLNGSAYASQNGTANASLSANNVNVSAYANTNLSWYYDCYNAYYNESVQSETWQLEVLQYVPPDVVNASVALYSPANATKVNSPVNFTANLTQTSGANTSWVCSLYVNSTHVVVPANRTGYADMEGDTGNLPAGAGFAYVSPGLVGNSSASNNGIFGGYAVGNLNSSYFPSNDSLSVAAVLNITPGPYSHAAFLTGTHVTNNNNPIVAFGVGGYGNCTGAADELCLARYDDLDGCAYNYSAHYGVPTHVAAVYNATGAKLYVDGAEACSMDFTGDPFDWVSGSMYIDGRSGFNEALNGTIDEVEVYGRDLTASEVTASYNRYLAKKNAVSVDVVANATVAISKDVSAFTQQNATWYYECYSEYYTESIYSGTQQFEVAYPFTEWAVSSFNVSDTMAQGSANSYWQAFDRNSGTYWQSGLTAVDQWFMLRLNNQSPFNLNRADMVFYDINYDVDGGEIYGSNAANPSWTSPVWEPLGSWSSDPSGNVSVEFTNNTKTYRWYLFNFTTVNSPANPAMREFYAYGNQSAATTFYLSDVVAPAQSFAENVTITWQSDGGTAPRTYNVTIFNGTSNTTVATGLTNTQYIYTAPDDVTNAVAYVSAQDALGNVLYAQSNPFNVSILYVSVQLNDTTTSSAVNTFCTIVDEKVAEGHVPQYLNTSNDLAPLTSNSYANMFDNNFGSWWQTTIIGSPSWLLMRETSQRAFEIRQVNFTFYDTTYDADAGVWYGSNDANPNGTSGTWEYLDAWASDPTGTISLDNANGKRYKWYLLNFTNVVAPAGPAILEMKLDMTAYESVGDVCTTNGTVTFKDDLATSDERAYVVQTYNGSGVYDAVQEFNVTGDATVVVQTKQVLDILTIVANQSSYWNGTDVEWRVDFTTNGVVNAVTSNTSITFSNATTVIGNVNDVGPGQVAVSVTVQEEFQGVNYTSSDVAYFNVSKLQAATNVQPSNVTFTTPYDLSANWTVATGGYSTPTYTVIVNTNGTNVTVASGITATSVLFNVSGQTVNGKVYVRADDGLAPTQVAENELPFIVNLTPTFGAASCGVTLPNELDQPGRAQVPVNFTVTAPLGFSGANGTVTLYDGGVVSTSTNCTVVVLNATTARYECFVPMRYYDHAALYDVNATLVTSPGYSVFTQQSNLCDYQELIAAQRSVSLITFPTAGPGVNNAQSAQTMVVSNTANGLVNLSVTAKDLTGRTTPAVTLGAAYFKVGPTLLGAKTMIHNTAVPLNVTIAPGAGANASLLFWVSMPVTQAVQEYYSATPWSLGVTG